jgi:hypothetical protein
MKAIVCSRTFRLSLSLLLAVGLAACGGSSGQKASPTSADAGLAVYDRDAGGVGYSPDTEDMGYTKRYEGDAFYDHLNGGYAIVEQGLAKFTDLNQVETGSPGAIGGETAVLWEPDGRRDTLMPPNPRGERIYTVVVVLDGYMTGGDAIARIAFVSRTWGDALNPKDPAATPAATPPNQVYTYTVDKGTAAALLDYFWVKGAPAATETAES